MPLEPDGTVLAGTISAQEAARRLGVKPATLYTYVSRGWIESLPGTSARSRRYRVLDVEALRTRTGATKGHAAVASGAMGWGQPVVDTAISAIDERGPIYRGVPAASLLSDGLEAACGVLWAPGAEADAWCAPLDFAPAPGPEDAAPIARLTAFVALDGLREPWSAAFTGAALSIQAAHLIRRCAAALGPPIPPRGTVAAVLCRAMGVPEAEPDVDAALVWCADHELNASTFAARVAASTGAGLHAVVGAGLGALAGPRHGALSARVEHLLDDLDDLDGPLAERAMRVVARSPALPGFGHPLYPQGDPRAHDLMHRAGLRGGQGWARVQAIADAAARQGHPPPNLDFGLVALRHAWGLPKWAPSTLFAVGRMAGWVAHLHEERARGQLIRPRARYIGPPLGLSSS